MQETVSNSTQRSAKRRNRRKNAPGDARGCSSLQARGNHAQHDAKLRDARRQLDIESDDVEVARGFKVRVDGVREQRYGDAGDGYNGEERHLQAGIEQAARACNEQAKRGKADGVQLAALAVDEPAHEVKRHHPEGALHRRGKAGEECERK